ncbi:hypothetical protein PQR37_05905 [Paraburkholderia nemoris]|uniref:hypothetical protein n=1 Tax=Paraburkholderia nemoris TaxID=2793076 RepID=UPI0038B8D28D
MNTIAIKLDVARKRRTDLTAEKNLIASQIVAPATDTSNISETTKRPFESASLLITAIAALAHTSAPIKRVAIRRCLHILSLTA